MGLLMYLFRTRGRRLDACSGWSRAAMPDRLNETAYALACTWPAPTALLEDRQSCACLEEIRYERNLDRLHACPIDAVAARAM